MKILKENGKELTTSIYNFNPFIVQPIHINRENQLIVGAVKNYQTDYTVPGGGLVMVMDIGGNLEAKYKFD